MCGGLFHIPYFHSQGTVSYTHLAGWAGEAALSFFGASITMGPHLWLLYKLLALYLLVPFYRLMLAKMPERMEKLLFAMIAAALAIRTACTYFQFALGISLYLACLLYTSSLIFD